MFWSKNKKNRYTPTNPSFTIQKWGLREVFIARTCFPDAKIYVGKNCHPNVVCKINILRCCTSLLDAPTFACLVPHCTTTTCSGSNCTGCESGYTLVNNAVWYGCDPHCLLCLDSQYFECRPGSDCNYCCDTDPCDVSCTVCPDNYYLGPGTPRMCYPCLSENGDPTACDSLGTYRKHYKTLFDSI